MDEIITAVVDKDFFSLFNLPVRNDTDVFDSSFVTPHMESGASLICVLVVSITAMIHILVNAPVVFGINVFIA